MRFLTRFLFSRLCENIIILNKKGKDKRVVVYCLIYRTIILWFSIFPLSGSLAILMTVTV